MSCRILLAVFVLFTSCQLRKMPDAAAVRKAEDYDRQQREFIAKNRAEQTLWNVAAAMTAEQTEALEAAVRQNPEDLESRKKLLIYYSRNGMKKTPPGYLHHTLWLIEHHPERVVLEPPDNLEGYAQAKQLWLAKADRDGLTVPVYLNASNFFRVRDKPLAEKMLWRAVAIDPRYVSHLPQLYYAALIGSNAAMPLGVVRSVSAEEAESVYATEVRKKLDASNDAGLLMDVGHRLILETVPMDTGFDRRALGMRYIEHALRLQPDLPGAQRLLDVARRGLLVPPLPGQYPVLAGQNEAERVKQLADLAVMTYMRGDMFSYYQHDLAKAKVEWAQARTVSEEVLRYPDHAAAYFSANMTLGMVTMRNGDQKQAAKYIRAAAQAPPSKETRYGFHPFADKLSTALLKAGERDAVAEFLEAYGQVNIPNGKRWSEAAVLIRAGRTPYWAQN